MPKADVDLGYAIGLKPDEAIRYFESKGYAIGFNWHDVEAKAHATAFTVAGVLKQDVLEDIRSALKKSLTEGGTLRQFERQLTPVLTQKGWLGKGLVADEDGVLEGKQLTPRRLRTIFETNMQSAYGAGRYEEQLANAAFRPYLERIAVLDTHTRPRHAALNGFTARIDDPVWQFMYPPDGYGCRCRVRARTQADIDAGGRVIQSWADKIETVKQAWGPDDTREVQALRINGELYTPDAGFGHNPGQGNLAALGQRLMDRSATAAPRTASLAIDAVLSRPEVMDAVAGDVRRWVDQVSVRGAPRGDVKRMGGISPALLTRLEEHGVSPASVTLSADDTQVSQFPGPLWSALPALLKTPAAVLLDGNDLIYLMHWKDALRGVRATATDKGYGLTLINAGASVGMRELNALASSTLLTGERP